MGVPLSKTKSIDYTRRRRTRRLPDPGSTPGASTKNGIVGIPTVPFFILHKRLLRGPFRQRVGARCHAEQVREVAAYIGVRRDFAERVADILHGRRTMSSSCHAPGESRMLHPEGSSWLS